MPPLTPKNAGGPHDMRTMPDSPSLGTIWTIGHSTHPFEDFLEMLAAWKIDTLVDVRRFPGSRRHPQFNDTSLAQRLSSAGIRYRPLPQLGGRRPLKADSVNVGWRIAGFRGYADYMQTGEFKKACDALKTCGAEARTVMMCAEAVPWRCHRRLIADALLVQGWTVEHILSVKELQRHVLTTFARVSGRDVTYPGETQHPTLF